MMLLDDPRTWKGNILEADESSAKKRGNYAPTTKSSKRIAVRIEVLLASLAMPVG